MFFLFTDSWYVESSVEMSSADSDPGKDSDSTCCPTPERGVGERVGLVQGTAGSTAMPVYIHVPVCGATCRYRAHFYVLSNVKVWRVVSLHLG